jgi:hypothetical protein
VDGYARPLNLALRHPPIVRPRLVDYPRLPEQRLHVLGIAWAALAERHLPGCVLQHLVHQRAVNGFQVGQP